MSEAKSDSTVLLSAENATHFLECSHCIGHSKQEYYMRCHVLKVMGSDRLKVLVFGERNWKGREHIKHIRYVDSNRVVGR